MRTISLQELSTLLESQFTTPTEKPLLVFLDVEGCHACELFYAAVDTPAVSDALAPLVDRVRVVIEGQPPIFSPPVYPAVVGFIGGVRHWEGLGDPAIVDELVEAIEEWVTSPHPHQISLSPGLQECLMAILNAGESGLYDYGPGGNAARPQMDRHIKIYNNHPSRAMFLPDRTPEERASVYSNIGKVSTVQVHRGQYVANGRLYRNTAAIGTGPCWVGTVAGEYNTPPAAPTGFNDDGVFNANGVNPNDRSHEDTVRAGTDAQALSWQFYQINGWGCGGTALAKISVRHCWI